MGLSRRVGNPCTTATRDATSGKKDVTRMITVARAGLKRLGWTSCKEHAVLYEGFARSELGRG
jgi:hypothetical protein